MVIPPEDGHKGHNKEDTGLAQEGEGGDGKEGSHYAGHINPLHHATDQFHHKFGVPGKEEGCTHYILPSSYYDTSLSNHDPNYPLPLLSNPD